MSLILLLFAIELHAQSDSVASLNLSVGLNKTTSLVFPQIIKSIDRGSRDLLVQKVSGVENVLQVKAAKENFSETNMTVITADGKLYSFIVRYATEPSHFIIQMDSTTPIFEKIAGQKQSMRGISNKKYEMILRMKGLYIDKEILYCQLELENRSNISYDIDILRFYIKDKKQSRRTASQELVQAPLYVYGNTGTIGGQFKQIIVVALPKFTIPDKKLFYVEIMEKNGGRHLQLKIKNKIIIQSKAINGLQDHS